MTHIAGLAPRDFSAWLQDEGITRAFLVWDDDEGAVRPSHEALAPLARMLEHDERDFDQHEGIFLERGQTSGALLTAFVHRTCRGQGAGGVRYWSYDSIAGLLRDGLRLAWGMTHKNALAGLWWGGGKGVIARGTADDDELGAETRRAVYEDYGRFMTGLRGCYVTAEDAGTFVDDMAAVFSQTRFTTCIPASLGGSGNPSVPTARGVVRGMEAALHDAGQTEGLEGKTVAVQGLGNVGGPLVGMLAERGVARVVATDVVEGRDVSLRAAHPSLDLDVRVVDRTDTSILAVEADVLAPCATGGTLSAETIRSVAAPIVCGAANNQLADPEPGRDDRVLADKGITYVPDFLVNRMGIVHCADEQAGHVDDDESLERHLGDAWEGGIYRLTCHVLEHARSQGATPHQVALQLAEAKSRELNPIWGHRGKRIIRSLIDSRWAEH